MSTKRGSWASLVAQLVKNLLAVRETWVRSLGWEGPLEEGMATHSSILAWRIPWTEEPGGLQSMGSHRIRHNWVIKRTHTHTHTHTHTRLLLAKIVGWFEHQQRWYLQCAEIPWTVTYTHTHPHTEAIQWSALEGANSFWKLVNKEEESGIYSIFSILKVAQLCPTRYRYKGIVFL